MQALDMSDIYPKIVEVVTSSEYKDDKQYLATLAIVTLQARLNTLSLFALTVRGKKMTDKRRESVNELLSDVVFYTVILMWISNLDCEEFAFDTVRAHSEEYQDDYQTDPILCMNLAMLSSAQLLELLFDDGEFADTIAEVAGMDPTTGALIEDDPTADPDTELPDEESAGYIGSILACAMMFADIMDTDFDVILYNVSLLTAEDI